jgi:chromosome segregation ATPase
MSEDRLEQIRFKITRGSHFEKATLPYSKYAIDAIDNDLPWLLREVEQLRARIAELEADRDSESRWAKEYLARAEKAEADAERLYGVLGKFRIVISGYAHASESHLPEVDAALAAHNAGKDGKE